MIRVNFGDVEINTGEQSYIFRPSFRNCFKLGSPKEVVDLFSDLHAVNLSKYIDSPVFLNAFKLQSKKILPAAYIVLDACCDSDPVDLIGQYNGLRYRKGLMSFENMIIIAKHLLKHMIIGNPDSDSESKGEYKDEFDASELVDSAIIHLGLTEDQALDLSMSRFQNMVELKYPKEKPAYPTDQEYDDCMEWLESVNKVRD